MSNTVLAKTLEFVGESIEAGTSAFFGTPRFVWLIPVVLVLAILVLFISPIGWVTEKPVQEIIAPTVIALAACVVGYFHYKQRSTLSLMLTCFVWALFLRELHLPLTNSGFYFAIVILAGWAVVERELLRGWLQNKNIAILLPAAFWTYIVTKIFDRHYVDFLPYYSQWNNNVEETLETCGHLTVFALVIVALVDALTKNKNRPA